MLRRGALKYIDAPAPEIYDVASDPDELRDLAGSHPDEADLAAALGAFRSAADPAASQRASGVLDPESEARLRSLGYAAAPSLPSGEASRRGRDPKTMIGYLRDYDRAVGLAASGKVEEGSALLRELIRKAPENFMARHIDALALAQQDDPAAGLLFRQLDEENPGQAVARLGMALARAREGGGSDAVQGLTADLLAWALVTWLQLITFSFPFTPFLFFKLVKDYHMELSM